MEKEYEKLKAKKSDIDLQLLANAQEIEKLSSANNKTKEVY